MSFACCACSGFETSPLTLFFEIHKQIDIWTAFVKSKPCRALLETVFAPREQKSLNNLCAFHTRSPTQDITTVNIFFQIYEKAIDELRYSSLYANLCRRLYHEVRNFDPPPPAPLGSAAPKPNVRNIVLMMLCLKSSVTFRRFCDVK